jgi:hypothetical protein
MNMMPMNAIEEFARMLQAQGRGGDTILAHINPREAMMLKRAGGRGRVNPRTGLLEFFEDPDAEGYLGGGEWYFDDEGFYNNEGVWNEWDDADLGEMPAVEMPRFDFGGAPAEMLTDMPPIAPPFVDVADNPFTVLERDIAANVAPWLEPQRNPMFDVAGPTVGQDVSDTLARESAPYGTYPDGTPRPRPMPFQLTREAQDLKFGNNRDNRARTDRASAESAARRIGSGGAVPSAAVTALSREPYTPDVINQMLGLQKDAQANQLTSALAQLASEYAAQGKRLDPRTVALMRMMAARQGNAERRALLLSATDRNQAARQAYAGAATRLYNTQVVAQTRAAHELGNILANTRYERWQDQIPNFLELLKYSSAAPTV